MRTLLRLTALQALCLTLFVLADAATQPAGASAESCTNASLNADAQVLPALQLKSVVERLRLRGFKEFRSHPMFDNVYTCPQGRIVGRVTRPATKTRPALLLAKLDKTFSFSSQGRASFDLKKTTKGSRYLKTRTRTAAKVSIRRYDAEGASTSYSRTVTLKN